MVSGLSFLTTIRTDIMEEILATKTMMTPKIAHLTSIPYDNFSIDRECRFVVSKML